MSGGVEGNNPGVDRCFKAVVRSINKPRIINALVQSIRCVCKSQLYISHSCPLKTLLWKSKRGNSYYLLLRREVGEKCIVFVTHFEHPGPWPC